MSMDAEAMRTLYRRWLPGLWSADPDDMAAIGEEIFSPEAVAHWGEGKDRVGPHEITENVRKSVTMFEDVTVSLLNGPIVDGDWIAGRWEFAATYPGGIPGVQAPAGTSVRYTGMDLLRVDDGRRVVEYWPHGDNLSLMQQLQALG